MNLPAIDHPKLLLVDDSPASLRVLADALVDLGTIHLATSGAEGLSMARKIRPELILVDVEMPGMNGFEFFQAIKADPWTEGCSVIFVTGGKGAGSGGYEVTSLTEGAVDFLAKPIDATTARLRVRNHLVMKQRGDQLAAARLEMARLVHSLPSLVLSLDPFEQIAFSNDRCLEWFGLEENDIKGKPLAQVVGQAAAELIIERIPDVVSGGRAELNVTIETPNAGVRNIQALLVASERDGQHQGVIVLLNDVSRQRQAEFALAEEKERLRVTLESIGDAVIATDTDGRVTFINPIAERMTGWRSQDAMGTRIEDVMPLVDSDSNASLVNPVYVAIRERRIVGMALNCRLVVAGGQSYAVEDSAAPIKGPDGQMLGAIMVFHDVSEARALALKMTHLANHDALTDLPNRLLLQDRISVAMRSARHTGRKVALAILDVDDFKIINNTAGHLSGDRVIQLLGSRLLRALPKDATLARLGSDEFVALLPDVESANTVAETIAALREAAREHFQFSDHRFDVTMSAGVSIFPDDCGDEETLLRHADVALHRAKTDGKNRFCFFSSDLELRLLNRREAATSIRDALAEGRMEVHYQSQVDVVSRSVIGAEALVRIRRRDGSLIPPASFIPVAEENGLIVPIGREVIRQSCAMAAQWAKSGRPIKVAVNISARQFCDDDLVELITGNLREAGLDPSLLELEITESTLMIDTGQTVDILRQIKALGVKVSIDDFGTGYSSLKYLHHFPADTLKIDQGFTREFLTSKGDEAIVKAVITLGKSLGLDLVAEGVETEEQAEALVLLGCAKMQGYLFSRPVPSSQFAFHPTHGVTAAD